MERPALVAATGIGSIVVATLALVGVLDLPILALVPLLVATRGAAGILAGAPLVRSRLVSFSVSGAALVVLAAVRAGSVELDAIRGANAVLGPALVTRPVLLALGLTLAGAGMLVSSSAVSAAASQGRRPGAAAILEIGGAAGTLVLIAGAWAGPELDGVASAVVWLVAVGLLVVADRGMRAIARHTRVAQLAAAVAALGLVLGAMR